MIILCCTLSPILLMKEALCSGRLLAYFLSSVFKFFKCILSPVSPFLMGEGSLLFWSVHIGSSSLRLDYIEVCSGATVSLVITL